MYKVAMPPDYFMATGDVFIHTIVSTTVASQPTCSLYITIIYQVNKHIHV